MWMHVVLEFGMPVAIRSTASKWHFKSRICLLNLVIDVGCRGKKLTTLNIIADECYAKGDGAEGSAAARSAQQY